MCFGICQLIERRYGMMKSVLISIQPKWCERIANGSKTIEVRKTQPKLETPFKVYIYETKDKKFENIGVHWANGKTFEHSIGKVIGEFMCDEILGISNRDLSENYRRLTKYIITPSCLKVQELKDYLGFKNGYGWHISKLVIYDKPKELGEFKKPCIRECDCGGCEYAFWTYDYGFEGCMLEWGLTRPPQSWCYVESESE